MPRRKSFRPRAAVISLLLAFGLAAAAEEKEKPKEPLDLNTASAEELEKLPGVGEVIAARIIRHRKVSGRFRSVDELLIIRGISRRKLQQLRPYVTVVKEAEEAEGRE